MEFEKRLEKAIERGQRAGDAQARAAAQQAISEEELKRLHTQYRLELSEHIERCLKKLPDHFPGFRYETVVGDRGWGAAISRDDVGRPDGGRRNFFSRLEMTVRPYSTYHVLELSAKGTIRNKEIYNRTHFQRLGEADPQSFTEMVDLWVLEFAELYAAKG
ncbi:MAG: hypothetical protein WD278_03095 [Pirellulales bacterium]|jgi:hypothetical protein